ncbi:F-box protein At1g78280 isoform X1 [Nematostella vectensis]|uniref:F-box protein At1g78280 isoform X1 n=1 Tax=Nematostella vectensis TaxID=45351 RepID=UPI00207708C7|nr:F-box protein At1g78280 isoform X1 [Nematostella vectensis]
MAADTSLEKDCEFINSWPPLEPQEKTRKRKYPAPETHDSTRKENKCINHGRVVSNGTQSNISFPSFEYNTRPLSGDKYFPMATSALARWWKENSSSFSGLDSPKSSNPNTILNFVSRLPKAQDFLMDQIKQLKKNIPANPSCAGIHLALGSYYSKMRDYSKALKYLENAEKLDPGNKDIAWLKVKVLKDKLLQEQTEKCKGSLEKNKITVMPKPIKVERRHHTSLTAREFLLTYALTETPVIITGLVEHMTRDFWTIQYIKKRIGHMTVPLKKRVQQSCEWAKLEYAQDMKLADFIDSNMRSGNEPLYLFDWSLPTHAPHLAKELTIPRYFSGDFLQRTVDGSLYKDTWPSLFIAPAGLVSDLHVDGFGSNFWMALFQGRKKWTFFNKSDLPLLYPHCDDQSLNISFDVNLANPDTKYFPLLAQTTPRQCILEPGELLFVPHGSPHFVENLEDSLAVSANFVDLSNHSAVLEELGNMAIADPQAEALRAQLARKDFPTRMWSEQNDVPFQDFKRWPPHNYNDFDIDFTGEVYEKYGFKDQ